MLTPEKPYAADSPVEIWIRAAVVPSTRAAYEWLAHETAGFALDAESPWRGVTLPPEISPV